MTASGKNLNANENHKAMEVTPLCLNKTGIKDIIESYVDFTELDEKGNPIYLKEPATFYRFFETPIWQKQILTLAEYAGPLDLLESCIKQASKERHLQETLEQAIVIAVQGLDINLPPSYEGMTESLLALYLKFYPTHQKKALKLIDEATALPRDEYIRILKNILAHQQTAFVEDEKAQIERESKNDAEIAKFSDAFKQDDEKILRAAWLTFRSFIFETRVKVKDNPGLNYANLMHLLKGIEEKLPAQWNGKNADHFYDEILGILLQSVNQTITRQVFDAYVQGDKTIIANVMQSFDSYLHQTIFFSINKQGRFVNNVANRNYIELMKCGFDEIALRRTEIPGGIGLIKTSNELSAADRYCIEFIGKIQRCLPFRIRQFIYGTSNEQGLRFRADKLNQQPLTRRLGNETHQFLKCLNANTELGTHYFYEISGFRCTFWLKVGSPQMISIFISSISCHLSANIEAIREKLQKPEPAKATKCSLM